MAVEDGCRLRRPTPASTALRLPPCLKDGCRLRPRTSAYAEHDWLPPYDAPRPPVTRPTAGTPSAVTPTYVRPPLRPRAGSVMSFPVERWSI